ncbi:hypothetical protein E4T56_gene3466 [Termitomyces sp. T112]|nr:hypothetical protein E4T56_gene3466 [Termitomyces sp. T112]
MLIFSIFYDNFVKHPYFVYAGARKLWPPGSRSPQAFVSWTFCKCAGTRLLLFRDRSLIVQESPFKFVGFRQK